MPVVRHRVHQGDGRSGALIHKWVVIDTLQQALTGLLQYWTYHLLSTFLYCPALHYLWKSRSFTTFCALSQGCAASGCNLRAHGRNEILHKPAGRIRCISLRNAVQPRASDAQCDKAGPNLFGMPLRPAQRNREHGISPASMQTQQSINGPLDALRAHGTGLKHVAAGIALSAALIAGVHTGSSSAQQ